MYTFLPKKDPLRTYKTNSRSLKKLENVASNLPKLLLTNKVQKTINSLNVNSFSVNKIIKEESNEEINLAMSHLSFIAHSYIWGGNKPQSLLPQVIAEPWVKLSNYLGRPPILSYASYCLDNWHKIDAGEPVSLDNVALNYNFLGGIDEDWFVTIHVCIESEAKLAITSALDIAVAFENDSIEKNFLSEEVG